MRLETIGAIGVSAMMHGYLAFDADDELLVPFRTWRNTSTGPAAAELTELFGINIPLRWSIAHLYQAVLDEEPHVAEVRFLTTLAGYVHWRSPAARRSASATPRGCSRSTPRRTTTTPSWCAASTNSSPTRAPGLQLGDLLPEVLLAGQPAGELTADGAALLDPTGALRPGVPLCPPEGDAGTGMVATNAVAPRTGNVSAGTSIFAMVVLERPAAAACTTNSTSSRPRPATRSRWCTATTARASWRRGSAMFGRFAAAAGTPLDADAVFEALFREALDGEADAGGLLAYNHLAGEPIAGLTEGRPLFVRTPDSRLTLANFMRAQLYGVFGTLSLGMRVLDDEGVALDRMFAHGGMFRTAGVAQRFLAGALDAPVAVGETASEGGAWGIAVLASYLSARRRHRPRPATSNERVFADADIDVVDPDPADVAGFSAYLDRYRAGLAVERAAAEAL